MGILKRVGFVVAATGLSFAVTPGLSAQETIKVATAQRGNWDTSIPELGQRSGIFKKHGLNLEILYTQGGGEMQQAVISGGADVATATGIMGVLSAFSKGAPVRIIGAEATGAADLFWYVKADSPIQNLKDSNEKTIAYSANGSSSHGVVQALIRENGLKAKPVAAGSLAATFTQVMSGQIDIGWSAPPFATDLLEQKKIRILARGTDAKAFQGQTVRVNIASVDALRTRKDAVDRFMMAYRETLDWMYSDPAALKIYAEFAGIPEALAKRTRDEFFPKEALNPDKVVGLELILPDAVNLKFINAPLTKEQITELVQIPPRK